MSTKIEEYVRIVDSDFAKSYWEIKATTQSYLLTANALKKYTAGFCGIELQSQAKTDIKIIDFLINSLRGLPIQSPENLLSLQKKLSSEKSIKINSMTCEEFSKSVNTLVASEKTELATFESIYDMFLMRYFHQVNGMLVNTEAQLTQIKKELHILSPLSRL